MRQSERGEAYAQALRALQQRGELFFCSCSRREISEANGASLGCVAGCADRQRELEPGECSLRWRAAAGAVAAFEDLWQGPQRQSAADAADVVLRRRDGVYTYQLAVVVDDGAQAVNEVIRGADLLASTAGQILLQRSLGLAEPRYGHLPLLVEADGQKLAKSRHSLALDASSAGLQLFETLQRLRQNPPTALRGAPVAELWQWALSNWQPAALAGLARVPLSVAPTALEATWDR